MPVPGPRNQFRPEPGYTNPGRETPTLFNRWHRPGPVVEFGRSPGTMAISTRGMVLAHGQIRRMYRQSVNYIGGGMAFDWTRNDPAPGRNRSPLDGYFITRALRYMTRSIYMAAGADNSRYSALHTQVQPQVRSKPVSVGAGGVRNRPTIRNRLTSFGSRVPPLNSKVPAAQ